MIYFIIFTLIFGFLVFYTKTLFEEIETELYTTKVENENLKQKLKQKLK